MDCDAIRRTADGIRILGAAIASGGVTAVAACSQIHEFAATLDRVERDLNDGFLRQTRTFYEALNARGLLDFAEKRRRSSRSLYIRKGGVKK